MKILLAPLLLLVVLVAAIFVGMDRHERRRQADALEAKIEALTEKHRWTESDAAAARLNRQIADLEGQLAKLRP